MKGKGEKSDGKKKIKGKALRGAERSKRYFWKDTKPISKKSKMLALGNLTEFKKFRNY